MGRLRIGEYQLLSRQQSHFPRRHEPRIHRGFNQRTAGGEHSSRKSDRPLAGRRIRIRLELLNLNTSLVLNRDNPSADGIKNQVGEIVETEFLKNVLAVGDDRGGAKIEQSRDIFVGLTLGEQL